MDKVEKLVDRSGSGEVSNVDRATGSSVGSTKSDLEGSRRVLRLLFDRGVRLRNDEIACSIERFLPGNYSSGCCTGILPCFPARSFQGDPCPTCCNRNRGMVSWRWH